MKKHKPNTNGKDSETNGKFRLFSFYTLTNSILTLFLFLSVSCNNNSDSTKESSKKKNQERFDPNISENEAVNFAKQLHQSFVTQDTAFIGQYLIADSLKQIIKDNFHFSNLKENDFGFSFLYTDDQIAIDFIDAQQNDGEIRFISFYKDSASLDAHIILRAFFPPMQVNFYDFHLQKGTNGIFIKDIYDYNAGGNYSDYIGEQMSFYRQSGLTQDSCAIFNEFITEHTNLIKTHISTGNVSLAYKLFLQIPDVYRNTKIMTHLGESIAFASDQEQVHALFLKDKMSRLLNPKDTLLTSFYLHAINQDYLRSESALDQLEMETGEDEIYHFLKGVINIESNTLDKAIASLNLAIAEHPESFIYHWTKVNALLLQKEYQMAVESLVLMNDYFNMKDQNWDKEFMAYPEFLFSEEYEVWQQKLEL